MPKAYPVEKLKLEGLSYSPPSSKPSPEKPKSEEKPYASPPLSLLPSSPSKEEKSKAHEKDYPSASPPKSYPEKPKAEGKPYLPLSPPLFSPTPPPSKDGIEKPKVEKKPEEKSDAVPASKEDKAKPYDKPKSNEKPHSPPSPQKPHPQEKDEQDKQKNQVAKKGAKVGCAAGKCRRDDPVTCDIPLSRSSSSNSTPSDCYIWWPPQEVCGKDSKSSSPALSSLRPRVRGWSTGSAFLLTLTRPLFY
jgi:hypothetical protein